MSKSDILGKTRELLSGLPGQKIAVVYDLLQKLCGKEANIWLLRLKKFLREENPFFPVLTTWMKIAIGGEIKSAKDFLAAIKDKGIKIGPDASGALKRIKYSQDTQDLRLVIISKGDLVNFTNIQSWFEYARECGIRFCPSDAVPNIVLEEYKKSLDLAMSPETFLDDFQLLPLVIITNPIELPNDLPSYFVLRKEYGEKLELTRIHCHKEFPVGSRWVFVKTH